MEGKWLMLMYEVNVILVQLLHVIVCLLLASRLHSIATIVNISYLKKYSKFEGYILCGLTKLDNLTMITNKIKY